MSKIIKSGQCVETHPRQLPSVDVDSFFINSGATWPEYTVTDTATNNSKQDSLPSEGKQQESTPLDTVDDVKETETTTTDIEPNKEENTAEEEKNEVAKVSADIDDDNDTENDEEDVVVTINQADRKRLESVLMDFDDKPKSKFYARQEKPIDQRTVTGHTAVSESEVEAVNLDHIADVAATIESLFSGAKEQAGAAAEEAQLHAGEIVNDANQRAKKAMDDAKQHAAKITFGAENKANSIMGEASKQADSIISKAKDQADLIIEGTRQKAEKSLEKTKQQAETILENANKEASQIIEEANKVTANMIEEAKTQSIAIKEQAHQEGLAEGRQDAVNVVRQELTENLTKALALVNEIESERMQRISSSEPELLKLAVTIAEKIIGEELKTDALCQLQIVREALTRTTTANKITIRIHSDDLPIVRDNLTLLQSSFSEPKPIEVKEDCSITRGSCFVETDHGNLDVRIRSQLEQIMTELFKAGRLE